MNLENIYKILDSIKLDKETKENILKIIDQKINNDMKEVLSKMDIYSTKMESYSAKMDSQNKTTLWVISIAMAIMLTIFAIK